MPLDKEQQLRDVGLNGILVLKNLLNTIDHKAEEIQELVGKTKHRCKQMEESVKLLCKKLKEEGE